MRTSGRAARPRMVPRDHITARQSFRWVPGAILLLVVTHVASPDATVGSPSAANEYPAINEGSPKQYRAYRRMHGRSERFGQEGWLEAWTELDQQGFRYEIVSERGSDYIRNRVLKTLLEREQETVAKGESSRADFNASNYEFSEPAEQQPGERHVLIKPKRKDVMLLDGRMVLTPDGRELLRVEGRLSKSPSFWTSLVRIVRHYARLDGVRVPVSVETTARIKLAGASRLRVDYEYESINGRPLSVTARRSAAAAAAGR